MASLRAKYAQISPSKPVFTEPDEFGQSHRLNQSSSKFDHSVQFSQNRKNVSRGTKSSSKRSNWKADKEFEETVMKYLETQTNILQKLNSQGYIQDLEMQRRGIDFIGYYKDKEIKVDVKSIATNDFKTFCFELAGNVHSGQVGWLLNPSIETDYYLLTYHDVGNYGSNYKEAKHHMTLDNINETVAYLISKEKIKEIIQQHLKSNNLQKVVDQIRSYGPQFKGWRRSVRFKVSNNSVYPYDRNDWKGVNYVYPTLSPQLYEQPINVVINRELLKEVAEEIWRIS